MLLNSDFCRCTFKLIGLLYLIQLAHGIAIIKQPRDVVVIESETVELECVFNETIDCVWYKDENSVNMIKNYKYTRRIGAELTEDCSVVIDPVAMEDDGRWHCGNIGSDTIHSVTSKTIWLRVHALEMVKQPEDSSYDVYEDQEVTLVCEFNARVNCSWMKDGREVNVAEFYVDKASRGMNSQLCSIVFVNVRKEQEGIWVCSNTITDKLRKRVSSVNVEIKVTSVKAPIAKDLITQKPPADENLMISYLIGFMMVTAILLLLLIMMALAAILYHFFKDKIRKRSSKTSKQNTYDHGSREQLINAEEPDIVITKPQIKPYVRADMAYNNSKSNKQIKANKHD